MHSATFVLLLLFATAVSDAGDSGKVDTTMASIPRAAIESAGDAIARALDILGPMKADTWEVFSSQPRASLVTGLDSLVPFLSDRISGRRLWRVCVDSVRFEGGKWVDAAIENQRLKNFEVLLDPETGQPLRIFGSSVDGAVTTAPVPHWKEATDQLCQLGEVYHRVPDEPPQKGFFEVLYKAAPLNPVRAKQILGLYVLWSHGGDSPRACWVIQSLGIPWEIGAGGIAGVVPEDPRTVETNFRCIYDANTGQWVLCTGWPFKR
jgi:hypothetical protein